MRMFCSAQVSSRWSASGQEAGAAPALHDAAHGLAVLLVVHALGLGQRHEEVVVDPLGQLGQHLVLAPAQHDRRQRRADPVEVAIADHPPPLVAQLVLVQQAPGGPEPLPVDELHDRDQFLQPVLQRGAREQKLSPGSMPRIATR